MQKRTKENVVQSRYRDEKMSKQSTVRRYGKQHKKSKCDRLFAELPQTPVRLAVGKAPAEKAADDAINTLLEKVNAINIQDENLGPPSPQKTPLRSPQRQPRGPKTPEPDPTLRAEPEKQLESPISGAEDGHLRILSWSEVCPPGDRIVKIAEASYAEVYRVTNERGTSIIKVIRMESPIRAQTKAQEKSGLVDEEPRSEADLMGELKISEWLADIPGFVVYKERYIVQGKTCRELLETHQAFHKKAKRQDPGRLQFYPSPSRYLNDTKFLVVELGDAGVALEDFQLQSADQLWDIFFHVAIALARAEAQIEFEVSHQSTTARTWLTELAPRFT
jgi:serine/threonine-protein kinase haspin